MPTARRRLLRRAPAVTSVPANQQRRLAKLRDKLEHERAILARWQTRLRRAFSTVERAGKKIARLERQILQLEGN